VREVRLRWSGVKGVADQARIAYDLLTQLGLTCAEPEPERIAVVQGRLRLVMVARGPTAGVVQQALHAARRDPRWPPTTEIDVDPLDT
jgi:hypothetical protein